MDIVSPPTTPLGHLRPLVRRHLLSALGRGTVEHEPNFLRALYCHYVFDDQREQFRSAITSLKKLGTFVDTDTFVRMATDTRPVSGRYFHLSFDDGFANLYHNAAPILEDLSVPAIVFVPTQMVGADYETLRDYCLNRTRYGAVIETLTWGQLAELVGRGMEVGSHTRTHTRLAGLADRDRVALRDELVGSKDDIEQRLSVECKYIAWPFGRLRDIDRSSLEAVSESGYRGCFGAFRGSVFPGVTNPHVIPRHHFEAEWPYAHIQYFASGRHEY